MSSYFESSLITLSRGDESLANTVGSSPLKKKAGVIAGISRAERESPIGYGAMAEPKDVSLVHFIMIKKRSIISCACILFWAGKSASLVRGRVFSHRHVAIHRAHSADPSFD